MALFRDRLRELLGGSRKLRCELAKTLNVTERTVYHYETGYRKPDIEQFEIIADFFDVNGDFLLGRSDDPRRDSASRGGVAGDEYDA